MFIFVVSQIDYGITKEELFVNQLLNLVGALTKNFNVKNVDLKSKHTVSDSHGCCCVD